MFKTLLVLFFLFLFPSKVIAADSFVSIVNPIRGSDFWDLEEQKPADVVNSQTKILKNYELPATWLIRFDALGDQQIVDTLKFLPSEVGLFLEITPSLTRAAGVEYRESGNWHSAGSVFLTGYSQSDRVKLINSAFERFLSVFSYYPKSVGAWWIDSYSLSFMQQSFGITSALIVADQYSTDNYQIWGQYFGTPYYPSKVNALRPAQEISEKLPVVITQWANRDPVNGYGKGVEESTYSVQANDYLDYHGLGTNYFGSLLNIYLKQQFDQFGHLVIGLENSYLWSKYGIEYEKQIELLFDKQKRGEISVVTLQDFSDWYKSEFPLLSPDHLIIADDPLGTNKKTVWFMNLYYRVGWFFNRNGSVFRDLRQYILGQEELCLKVACEQLNFATSATRVLDEVSFNERWIIDEGEIKNFEISKNDVVSFSYQNEAEKKRTIKFLNKDINIDGINYSIDGAILRAKSQNLMPADIRAEDIQGVVWQQSLGEFFIPLLKFLIFLILLVFIPGYLLVKNITTNLLERIFLSLVCGIVILVLISYIVFFVKQFWWVIYAYPLLSALLFIYKREYLNFNLRIEKPAISLLIILGTIFLMLPVFRSGLLFNFGIGFWGPNTHDGIWHISLINQILKGLPAENPIYAGETLTNYHYLYDLLLAVTHQVVGIQVIDLLFRFYPLLFSLLLGFGTYSLVRILFPPNAGQISALLSLYLVYFAGSFGWIVDLFKTGTLGGESAFWANQSISFNLNPPYAASLILLIGFLHLIKNTAQQARSRNLILVSGLLLGSLIGFKAYAAILGFASLAILATWQFLKIKNLTPFLILGFGGLLSLGIYLPNFSYSQIFILSPFWFIHSMVDIPDRVGWERLSLARNASLEGGQWIKLIAVEVVGLFLFVVGNLGVRFISLFNLIKIRQIFRSNLVFFIFIFSSLSLLFPLLLIQKGTPWNTIQFMYYFLYISAVFGGLVLFNLFKLRSYFTHILVIILIVIAPINSIATAKGYLFPLPHAYISSEELEALTFLSDQEDGIVLTYPYDPRFRQALGDPFQVSVYDSTAYVSAFSKKVTFMEDEMQNEILEKNYKKRRALARDFFLNNSEIDKSKEFLRSNNIRYVYLPKLFNVNLNDGDLGLDRVFENKSVKIFKVK